MKTFWTYAAVGGFVLSVSGAALACSYGQQTVKADVPMTVASAPTADSVKSDKK